MEIQYPRDVVHNPLAILRKAGYQYFVDPVTKKESYILRLTTEYYPRFHLYLEEKDADIVFSLHLDQKKPSYKGSRAHGGEYDGPTVEKEMARIERWVASMTGAPLKSVASKPATPPPQAPPPKEQQPERKHDSFGGIFM